MTSKSVADSTVSFPISVVDPIRAVFKLGDLNTVNVTTTSPLSDGRMFSLCRKSSAFATICLMSVCLGGELFCSSYSMFIMFRSIFGCLSQNGCSEPDCKRAFFHHALNGMCVYSETSGCVCPPMDYHLSMLLDEMFAIVSSAPLLCFVHCLSKFRLFFFFFWMFLVNYEKKTCISFSFSSVHECLLGISQSSF